MRDVNSDEHRSAAMQGGHVLPRHLSADSATTPHSPRRHTGLLAGIAGGVLLIAALTTLQLTSNAGYDSAEAQFRESARAVADTHVVIDESNSELRASQESASLLAERDTGTLVDAALKEDLVAATGSAVDTIEAADSLLVESTSPVGDKPFWFWELYSAEAALAQHSQDADDLNARLQDQGDEIDAAHESLEAAGTALIGSAAEAATAYEAAHVSARNDDVIALREATATAGSITTIDSDAVMAFESLQSAAAQLIASEKAELAEKAGPLLETRLEIEAFARSIAPGVLLEFDWAPIVNGVGYNGSMGGYTTWWWDDPGRATIELSNSVAEQWPADRSKALVVHEVGHAISVKCADMYDSSTQDSIEKWATAWAISMGYTDDANGVWAYGYPPQSYIDAAAGCR